jgi:ABC-type multidrug transport system fused ATPase/permease subunit
MFFKIYKSIEVKYQKILIFIFFLSLFASFFEFLGLGLVFLFIQSFFLEKKNNLINIIISNISILDQSIISKNNIFIIIFIFFVFKNFFLMFFNWKLHTFLFSLKNFFHQKILFNYTKGKYENVINTQYSEIYKNFESANLTQLILNNYILIYSEIISFLFLFALLIYVNASVTLYAVLIMFFILFLYQFVINPYINKKGLIQNALLKYIESFKLDLILGVKEIKVYQKEDFFLDKFKKINSKYSFLQRTNASLKSFFRNIAEILIITLATLFIIFFIGEMTIFNIASIGFYVLVLLRLFPSFTRIYQLSYTIKYNKFSASAFLQSLQDNVINKKNIHTNLIKKTSNNKSALFFENVSFGYNSNLLIKNINLSLKKNTIVGITGESGIGKSSLLDLIMCFYLPTKGNIFHKGKNINSDIKSTRSNIAYVTQNSYFINDTIEKNVAFGQNSEEIDKELVKDCLKKAEFDFRNYKTDKIINFVVGNNANMLSGGQKQKLCLARALYKKSDILLFDEFTNALDKSADEKIFSTIKKYAKEKLIVIISHNSRILRKCDIVYKLENFNFKRTKI